MVGGVGNVGNASEDVRSKVWAMTFSTDGKVLNKMKQLYQSSLKSAAAPGDPGDDSNDELDEPSDHNPQRGDPLPHIPKHNDGSGSHYSGSGKGPAHFGGGPPGYPDNGGNGGNGSDENSHCTHWSNNQDRCPDCNCHWGYSVPVAVHPWYNTPGIMEVVEHHHTHMHEWLLQLIQEHISVCLSITEGMKLHQVEHSSVGKYEGFSKFGDLKKWLTNLVILFEVSMYVAKTMIKKECWALLNSWTVKHESGITAMW